MDTSDRDCTSAEPLVSSTLPDTCPRCAGPLSKDLEASSWSLSPFIRDSFSTIGTALGGSVSAFYGFNHGMPYIQKFVRGPMWLQFLVGVPPIMLFTSTCSGLAGGAVPALAQLTVSSYHAALASSHSSASQATMQKVTHSQEASAIGRMQSEKHAHSHTS